MADCPQSTPPPEHLETPGPFRHAQLAFLPEPHAVAAFHLGDFLMDLLLDSREVRHDPVERVGGVVDDLNACACALEESASYLEMKPVQADLQRWADAVTKLKNEVVDTMCERFPEETRSREAAAVARWWKGRRDAPRS